MKQILIETEKIPTQQKKSKSIPHWFSTSWRRAGGRVVGRGRLGHGGGGSFVHGAAGVESAHHGTTAFGIARLTIGEQELLEADATVAVGVGEPEVVGGAVLEAALVREARRHATTEFEKARERDLGVVRRADAVEDFARVVDLVGG